MEQRKSFLLRINAQLWKEIEAWAQEDLRSVNGQIEFLLRQAVTKRRGSSAAHAPTEGSTPTAETGPIVPSSAPTPVSNPTPPEPAPPPPDDDFRIEQID